MLKTPFFAFCSTETLATQAALGETRFTDKGQLTETGVGYTFWSGRSSEERREAGVIFAIKTTHVQKLESISEVLNNHLMKMQIPLFLFVISCLFIQFNAFGDETLHCAFMPPSYKKEKGSMTSLTP